jgi:hypothetical protein
MIFRVIIKYEKNRKNPPKVIIKKNFLFGPLAFFLDSRGYDGPGAEFQDEEQIPTDCHVHGYYASSCGKACKVRCTVIFYFCRKFHLSFLFLEIVLHVCMLFAICTNILLWC